MGRPHIIHHRPNPFAVRFEVSTNIYLLHVPRSCLKLKVIEPLRSVLHACGTSCHLTLKVLLPYLLLNLGSRHTYNKCKKINVFILILITVYLNIQHDRYRLICLKTEVLITPAIPKQGVSENLVTTPISFYDKSLKILQPCDW